MPFLLDTIIPSSSTSKGFNIHQQCLFFTASNSIYTLENNSVQFIISLHGQIEDIQFNDNFCFAMTKSRLYMLKNDIILATLKLQSCKSSFAVNQFHLYISNDKNISIYEIPQRYNPIMFSKLADVKTHIENVVKIKLIEDKFILSVGEDCTVRLSCFEKNQSQILCYHQDIPVNVFYIEDKICENDRKDIFNNGDDDFSVINRLKKYYSIISISSRGTINEYNTREKKLIDRIFVDKGIKSACYDKNTLFLLCDDSTITILQNKKLLTVKINCDGYEIVKNGDYIIVRGETMIHSYLCSENQLEEMYFNQSLSTKEEEIENHLTCLNTFPLSQIINFAYNNDIMVSCSEQKINHFSFNRNKIIFVGFYEINEPIYQIFYKSHVLIAITEYGNVRVFDTNRKLLFREISLEFRVAYADTNDDNTLVLLSNFENNEINFLDIKKSIIIDTFKLSAPARKIKYFNNCIFALLMNSEMVRYNIFNGKVENHMYGKTINTFTITNGQLVVAQANELIFSDLQFNNQQVMNCYFVSRHRNEMFISQKSATAIDISYDSKTVIVGAQSNEIKIIDIKTKTILKTIKLSRNKEKENYKKKLGRERDDNFNQLDIIESLSIQYIPNGFIVLSREGISIYKIPTFKENIFLQGTTSKEQIQVNIEKRNFSAALEAALFYNCVESVKQILTLTNNEQADQIIRNIHHVNELKSTINHFILNNQEFSKSLYWLNRIIFYHTGHLIESDHEVIKHLREKNL